MVLLNMYYILLYNLSVIFALIEEISPTCFTNPSITGTHLGIFQRNSLVLAPSLNFTCSGNTTSLRWEVTQLTGDSNTPKTIELQIWRQTSSHMNNIDYTRVYNEMVTVTDSTSIFTITPTVATTYESGDIVGFYIPGSGELLQIPFGSARGNSYYEASVSPDATVRINTMATRIVLTKAPFLQSKLS